MALATRCPYCNTTFRVAQDQLKLRAGLVRCGSCKEIFNGIEHLLRPEAPPVPAPSAAPLPSPTPAPLPAPAPRPVPTPVPSASDFSAPDPLPPPEQSIEETDNFSATVSDSPDTSIPETSAHDDYAVPAETGTDASPAQQEELPPQIEVDGMPVYADFFEFLAAKEQFERDARNETEHANTVPVTEPVPEDPLLRMTLMEISDRNTDVDDESTGHRKTGADDAEQTDRLEQVIDDLQRKPDRRSRNMVQPEEHAASSEFVEEEQEDEDSSAEEVEEPSFVTSARRKQRFGPLITFLMATGSVLLLLALVAQATYTFRNQIAARYPEAKPVLTLGCALIGCKIGLPMQIESLSIESNELQAIANSENIYTLSTLLRNRAPIALRWPHIELSLNDGQEKPIVRRIFAPHEYLKSAQDIEQGFAAESEYPVKLTFALTDLKPAGYRVYLFYP